MRPFQQAATDRVLNLLPTLDYKELLNVVSQSLGTVYPFQRQFVEERALNDHPNRSAVFGNSSRGIISERDDPAIRKVSSFRDVANRVKISKALAHRAARPDHMNSATDPVASSAIQDPVHYQNHLSLRSDGEKVSPPPPRLPGENIKFGSLFTSKAMTKRRENLWKSELGEIDDEPQELEPLDVSAFASTSQDADEVAGNSSSASDCNGNTQFVQTDNKETRVTIDSTNPRLAASTMAETNGTPSLKSNRSTSRLSTKNLVSETAMGVSLSVKPHSISGNRLTSAARNSISWSAGTKQPSHKSLDNEAFKRATLQEVVVEVDERDLESNAPSRSRRIAPFSMPSSLSPATAPLQSVTALHDDPLDPPPPFDDDAFQLPTAHEAKRREEKVGRAAQVWRAATQSRSSSSTTATGVHSGAQPGARHRAMVEFDHLDSPPPFDEEANASSVRVEGQRPGWSTALVNSAAPAPAGSMKKIPAPVIPLLQLPSSVPPPLNEATHFNPRVSSMAASSPSRELKNGSGRKDRNTDYAQA